MCNGKCYNYFIRNTNSRKDFNIMAKNLIKTAHVALIVIFILAMFGCTPNNDNKTDEVTVTMPKTSEPDKGFDPIYGWGCGEHVHEPLIQSTLVKTNSDMEIENDLATSYAISDDAKTITFTIRDDVKFSDGSKLTASDVAFTVNKEVENVDNPADFSSIESAEAVSETACEVHLNKPDNTVLYLLATVGIVPESSYNSSSYGKSPIGSGRYKLETWERGSSATFVANENYYGGTPSIKRVKVLFVDEEASYSCAKTGEADVSYVSPLLSQNEVSNYNLLKVDTVDSRGISLPSVANSGKTVQVGTKTYESGNNVTCDFNVRYAINLALDKESLIQNCLYGCGKVANSVCDGLPWSSDVMKTEHDKEKAIEVLENAGWMTLGNEYRSKDGITCEFNLYYANSDSTRQALAYAFAEQMKEVGIKVNTIGASWDDIYPHQFTDAVLWGWGSNSPSELLSVIKSDGSCNFSQFTSEETDALINEATSQTDISESYKKLIEAQNYVSPEKASSWVWLANVDHTYFVKSGLKVADQKIHPHGHGWSLINNVDEWSWE